MKQQKSYVAVTVCSFLVVLFIMPLGHSLMILMEHYLDETALHYSAFMIGFAGMVITIVGVFERHDTKATILGLGGALLFWTGWVEFLFSYYAWRYGVHCDLLGSGIVETFTRYQDGIGTVRGFLIDGIPLETFDRSELKSIRGSRPEYLILPATFGMWMMVMMLYVLCTRTGCRFFNQLQRWFRLEHRIHLRPMVRNCAMVTFMEFNMMMWGCYLLLMFCYDPVFLGSGHWVTYFVGFGCLVGSVAMLRKQLRLRDWGSNIRMAIATVIVFWTFVEIMGRNGFFREVWIDPMHHVPHMVGIVVALIAVSGYAFLRKKVRSFSR